MFDSLVLGLGNPGEQYKNTKHNLGFILMEYIAQTNQISWTVNKKLCSSYSVHNIEGKKILLAKPLTFMNNSGISAQKLLRHFKLPSEKLTVFYDDIDIKFCNIRCKFSGSSGGHNGIKSIDNSIGNKYFRVRLGIQPKDQIKTDLATYVLSNFNKKEVAYIDTLRNVINENLLMLTSQNLDQMRKITNIINALFIENTKPSHQ